MQSTFNKTNLSIALLLLGCLGLWTPSFAADKNQAATPSADKPDYRALLDEGIRNNSLGRHGVAEKSFRAALLQCQSRPSTECSDITLRLALELSNQERFEEADLHFARLEKTIRASKTSLSLPRYLTYRAMDYANRKNFPEAMKFISNANQKRKALLKTAFENARSADPTAKQELDRTMIELAHGLYVQASISFKMGKTADAKVTAHLVRALVSKIKNIPDWWIAFADALLADIELRDGNIEAAEKRLRLALKAKQVALGNTRAVALSYMALGAIFQESKRSKDAIDTSRPGLSILRGELRQAPGISIERLEPFLEASLKIAEQNPSRRAELHGEMFAAAQLARTSQTARTVAQMAARFATGRPEIAEIVRRLQTQTQLRDELRITLGRTMIASAGNNTHGREIKKLKASYTKAAAAVGTLSKKIETLFPSYSELVSPTPSSAETVQSTLKPDEALVYFVFGNKGGYVFAVRHDSIKAARVDIRRSEIGNLIRRLRKPFDKIGARIASYDLPAAFEVYQKLLGPVQEALSSAKHIIVVSSGELLSLPFPLLVSQPPADGPDRYRTAAWLIRKHAFTQMPSVRTFTTFRRTVRPSAASNPFIGFGNPAFEGKASSSGITALSQHCQLDATIPPGLIRGLAPLPDTAVEVTRVAATLKAGRENVILGPDVTEKRLRSLPLDQYRVVYFATHGLLPGELKCQSQPALALSPATQSTPSRSEDGLLEASEIAGLKLDADLVVLSACNTGGGGSGKLGGESLSGLARAFFQAGTRSVLVSHWQVDSVATTRLMTRTFGHIGKANRRHTAQALQRAQLDLLQKKETAHPYFWAAFTLVGEGRDMNTGTRRLSQKQIGMSAE